MEEFWIGDFTQKRSSFFFVLCGVGRAHVSFGFEFPGLYFLVFSSTCLLPPLCPSLMDSFVFFLIRTRGWGTICRPDTVLGSGQKSEPGRALPMELIPGEQKTQGSSHGRSSTLWLSVNFSSQAFRIATVPMGTRDPAQILRLPSWGFWLGLSSSTSFNQESSVWQTTSVINNTAINIHIDSHLHF